MFDKLKRLLDGAVAQVNPWDNGQNFQSVMRRPATTPPPQRSQRPAPATTPGINFGGFNPSNPIGSLALSNLGQVGRLSAGIAGSLQRDVIPAVSRWTGVQQVLD